jgi:hypothetical protein
MARPEDYTPTLPFGKKGGRGWRCINLCRYTTILQAAVTDRQVAGRLRAMNIAILAESRQGDSYALHGQYVNPVPARVLHMIGHNIIYAGAEGCYLCDVERHRHLSCGKDNKDMPLSTLIPIGLLLTIMGGVLLVIKKRQKIAATLLVVGVMLIIGTMAIIGLATSSM